MSRLLARLSALATLAFSLALPAGGSTFVVDAGGGADFVVIADAVAAAQAGDSILVAPGLYTGAGNYEIDFWGKDLVLLAPSGPEATIIDCQGAGRAFRFHSGESTACCIEGFGLKDGDSTWGGLVHLAGASPRFIDCVFANGHAVSGGAVHCSADSATEFVRCAFRGNAAGVSGGAAHVSDAAPRFIDCRFEGNTAAAGGAVYCGVSGEAAFEGCAFIGNAGTQGGALHCVYAEAVVSACSFFGNVAEQGGGIYLFNCWPQVAASSFARNSDGIWCHAANPRIERSVLAFNGIGVSCSAGAAPTLHHCCLFGNLGDGACDPAADNLAEDPRFCDLNGGALDLCANSPCLPSGNPWGELIGAAGLGCEDCAQTAAAPASWSRIKHLYR